MVSTVARCSGGTDGRVIYVRTLVDIAGGRLRRDIDPASESSSSLCLTGSKRGGGPLVSVGEVVADCSIPVDLTEPLSGAILSSLTKA